MHKFNLKYLLMGIGLFFLLTILTLWSWNTLAQLFGLPHAQFRHLIALFFIIFILKGIFSADRHFDRFRKKIRNYDR
jgi:dolichyl-phosphate-mannose--protein O-mannosyl transferase